MCVQCGLRMDGEDAVIHRIHSLFLSVALWPLNYTLNRTKTPLLFTMDV